MHDGDAATLPRDRHIAACALVGDSPTFFINSELSEAAYYVAFRTWLVTQRARA